MRIAMIGPSFPYRGGIAHYTTLLYRNLSKRHETRFFGFKRQYPLWLFPGKSDRENGSELLKEDKIEYILDSMNPLTWIKVAREIIDYSPDLVIIPWWVVFWAPHFYIITKLINRKIGKKVLFVCHNVTEHESNFIKLIATKKVLKNGHYFLVHSQDEQRRLEEFLPYANILSSFHPTYEAFNQDSMTKEGAKKKLECDKDILLFFGFVRTYKGLDLLLRAMPRVLKNINVQLFVVGEFWDDKKVYLDLISELGLDNNITIIDKYVPNEEVATFLNAADLLVMPYKSVTGSGIIQLAFGFGLPVVVSNVGALSEIVKDGETGFVVPNGDIDAIADRIIYYYKNRCEGDFRENIRKDRYRFSWDNLINKIENFTN